MIEADPKLVTLQFNEAINSRNLESLIALMTADHQFIDTEGNVVRGRVAVEAAWRGFFSAFPDYQNVFSSVVIRGDRAIAFGHSRCSVPILDGPAIWTAVVRADKVAEWRVYADDDATRRSLGFEAPREP
jgi:ketosteroid isomerase-like protein